MRFCLCARICLYFAIFMLVFLKLILLDFTMYIFIVTTYIHLQKSKLFAFELSEQIIKMFYICSKPVDCWTKYR